MLVSWNMFDLSTRYERWGGALRCMFIFYSPETNSSIKYEAIRVTFRIVKSREYLHGMLTDKGSNW